MIPETSQAQGAAVEKPKKKKDKVRSAWISFIGRIVAQIVGAAATIVLGVVFVHKYSSRDDSKRERAATTEERPAATRVRRADGGVALAVLPLQNFSGNRDQDFFVDGMTEALIADLAQIQHLHVISRTSSMQYKDQRKPLPQIARELGVDLILEGSVARSGDRVRVTAQLIDANSDEHLWARTYDRTVRDVLTLQADVATAVAKEVDVALSSASRGHFTETRAVDPQAYELYLKGREAWNLRTADGFRDAIRYFDEALKRDSNFALAHAGLADTYSLSTPYALFSAGDTTLAKAKASAERALQLDEHLGEAHASLAAVHHRQEGDLESAEREFTRALELNPGYATGHQWYAVLLAEEGRADDALRHAQQAVSLDPLSGTMHQTLGIVHYYARRYDQAIASSRRALDLAPQLTLARAILARSLVLQGNPGGAIDVYQKRGAIADADLVSAAAVAYYRANDRARAGALFDSLQTRQPLPVIPLARWYAQTGDKTAACVTLERARASGMLLQPIKADPAFDDLRGDARFTALIRNGAAR